ncbi:DNA translocase FtsK [Peribacillus sp. B-H-3]|uniref:DNA translocase FtsK n=1 Tax=Peribacillus sp. B-H-3 TaxID=3400420 RepID=UPI003B013804
MKWLNKIKNWFQDEEEIIEIEEIIIDEPIDEEKLKTMDFSAYQEEQNLEKEKQKQKEKKLFDQASRNQREPNTKILFQYPKGEFKFPIIPDQSNPVKKQVRRKSEPARRRKPERGLENNKQEVKLNKEQRKTPFNIERSPKEESKNPGFAKAAAENKLSNKIIPSNVPFRPTEIPSPIYGYKQRPEKPPVKKEETIEHELKSKFASNTDMEVPAYLRSLEDKKKKDASEAMEENPEKSAGEELIIQPVNETSVQENTAAEVSQIPPTSFSMNHAEQNRAPEAPVNDQEMMMPSEELPSAVEDTMAYESDFVQESISAAIIPAETESLPEKTEEPAAVQSIEEDDQARRLEADVIQGPKKHLPFNVVMLKQDKKKLDFFSSFTEKKSPSPIAAKQAAERESEQKIAANAQALESIEEAAAAVAEREELAEVFEAVPSALPSAAEAINQDVKPENIVFESEDTHTEQISEEHEVESAGVLQEKSIMGDSDQELESHLEENPYYVFPDIDLLTPAAEAESDEYWLDEQALLLNETLKNFNVRAAVVNVTQGPAVTRFEVQPEPGVKVNKVTNLMDDIKLSLAAQDIRMEAPIPGKHTIGIEIPNRKSKPVFLREVLESQAFQQDDSPLSVALGLDISGQPIITDLRKMPHGLIAGATGSGKSVCINTMLVSLLYKATPQELKLLLIDPKMVELAPYNSIPHLVSPVITDVKAATAALKWAVEEMERRYELFVHAGVRDIGRFNDNADKAGQYSIKLPYIVVIIDELADLMMMSPADVEEAISRIAQKARACGIHLIVATQRPSVDVITGLIKANIPTRIAFSVSSQVDSRTILDSGGAEKLLGRGDMLFAENGSSKSVRLQGTFVSDEEIDQVVNHVKREQKPNYLFEQDELLNKAQISEETDELFFEACEFVVHQNNASTSSLQRRFRVGYNRAARLMEMMEKQGVISESRGSRPRDVLISEDELEFLLETNS